MHLQRLVGELGIARRIQIEELRIKDVEAEDAHVRDSDLIRRYASIVVRHRQTVRWTSYSRKSSLLQLRLVRMQVNDRRLSFNVTRIGQRDQLGAWIVWKAKK